MKIKRIEINKEEIRYCADCGSFFVGDFSEDKYSSTNTCTNCGHGLHVPKIVYERIFDSFNIHEEPYNDKEKVKTFSNKLHEFEWKENGFPKMFVFDFWVDKEKYPYNDIKGYRVVAESIKQAKEFIIKQNEGRYNSTPMDCFCISKTEFPTKPCIWEDFWIGDDY